MNIPSGIFREIAKNIAEDNCVLFLGAGASLGTGDEKGAPSSKDLKELLLDDLIKNYGFQKPDKIDNLSLDQVAESYDIKAGRKNLINVIADALKDIKKPLKIHELIVKLPFKIIITTNYDDLLEKQFEQAGKSICCIYYKEEDWSHSFSAWDDQTTLLVKLHGCVRRNDLPLIITARDYAEFLAESSLAKEILKYLVKNRTFLFVGYSLSDMDIRAAIFFKFWERTRPYNYSIQDEPIDSWKFSFWRDQGINIFQEDAVDFFEELLKYFTTDNLKKALTCKLHCYIENFRMQTYKIIEEKIALEFINDLKEKRAGDDDYEFRDDIVDIFIKPKHQKMLIPLIQSEDSEILGHILNLLEAPSIFLDYEILNTIIAVFKEASEDGIKHKLLEFFYNKLNDEQLNSVKDLIMNYANSDPVFKEYLQEAETSPFEPEKLGIRTLTEKLLSCLERDVQ